MNSKRKLILCILIISFSFLVLMIFSQKYFELDSFSELKKIGSFNDRIRVQIIKDSGIKYYPNDRKVVFYVVDKENIKMKVLGPLNVRFSPDTIQDIILVGHLHDNSFIASEVIIE